MSFLNAMTMRRGAHVEETPRAKIAPDRDAPQTERSADDTHWYYPSAIVGCGLSIDELTAAELTCLRSNVTCPACIARIEADRQICDACRVGHPENRQPWPSPHVCDPALS